MPRPPPAPSDVSPVQAEAMALARAHQKPGQTKEQTRLIAQGIAKGIEQYKRQQSARARERDKSRKRLERLRQTRPDAGADPAGGQPEALPGRRLAGVLPVLLGSGVLAALSLACGLLLLNGWTLSIAGQPVSSWLLAAIMPTLAALAAWLASAARRPHTQPFE